MDWKGLLGAAALTALKPIVIAILAIVAIILLIIPLILVWAYGFMTGLIFGIVTLLFIFVLHRTEMLDIEKFPWVAFAPIIAFFVGVVVEHRRLLQLYPLTTLLSTALIPDETYAFSIYSNIILTSTFLFVIVILLVIGLAKRT